MQQSPCDFPQGSILVEVKMNLQKLANLEKQKSIALIRAKRELEQATEEVARLINEEKQAKLDKENFAEHLRTILLDPLSNNEESTVVSNPTTNINSQIRAAPASIVKKHFPKMGLNYTEILRLQFCKIQISLREETPPLKQLGVLLRKLHRENDDSILTWWYKTQRSTARLFLIDNQYFNCIELIEFLKTEA